MSLIVPFHITGHLNTWTVFECHSVQHLVTSFYFKGSECATLGFYCAFWPPHWLSIKCHHVKKMIGYYTYLCCHLPFIFKDELISAETVNVITIQEKPHLKAITAKMAMKMQRTGERTYSGSISKVPNLYLDAEKVLHDSSQLFYNHFGTNFLMPFFKTFHCAFISLKKPCTCFGSNN